ncbi:hypothetical protein [Amycolatopsis sp. CA-128772]|uniref:hypothetical protein n=1 Tax=Amycolatopsis sp. CA-128772 TaxID=2073159 RepID=UPI000CD08CBC|nr:hypothetical protein [Amycolatopsis sp. CA-128772]
MTATEPAQADVLATIGKAVCAARNRMGLSVAGAAKAGRVDVRSWSNVENGERVKPKTYDGVAKTFELLPELVKNAPTSSNAAARLVAALAEVAPRDGKLPAPETVDAVALSDAQLLALFDAVTAELKARLDDRAGRLAELDKILSDRREAVRPAAERMGEKISREMAGGGTA